MVQFTIQLADHLDIRKISTIRLLDLSGNPMPTVVYLVAYSGDLKSRHVWILPNDAKLALQNIVLVVTNFGVKFL